MRTISKLVGAAFLSAALTANASHADEIKLLLGHTAPTNSDFEESAQLFAQKVNELSSGEISVEVVGGAALGGIPELWAQLRTGALDMHLFELGGVNFMKEGSEFKVLFAPFLFKDQEHLHRYVVSDVFERMMGQVEDETGIEFVGYVGDRQPRAVSTKDTPVVKPDDLKGLKIRIAMNPSIVATYEAFGAVPTPVPPTEILMALKTGVVDGQDQGLADYLQAGYDDPNPYYSPINTVRSGLGLWIAGDRWDSLSVQQRAWVEEAADYAAEVQNARFVETQTTALELAKERGVKISEPDMDAFKAAVAPAIEEMDGELWPEGLYDEIHGL